MAQSTMNLTQLQDYVRQFMFKAGQECPSKPVIPKYKVQQLRIRLHMEEAVTELEEAFFREHLEFVADSIADSLVVILGTAVACGIEIQPIFEEVMRSNMTKFIDGHRRADGKWIKGPSYESAKIAPLILQQLQD